MKLKGILRDEKFERLRGIIDQKAVEVDVLRKRIQEAAEAAAAANIVRDDVVDFETENGNSVCNLNTKEHKSKSAAITQTGNRVQDLAGVRNETKSSESKFGKAQVNICWVCRSNWWSCIDY